jgi:hypothetical protein
MISIARTTNRNVTRWRDGQMVLRWTAAGMLNAERSFRSRVTSKCPNSSMPYTGTPTLTPAPNLPVPPPRIHHGSSPKIHETRDILVDLAYADTAATVNSYRDDLTAKRHTPPLGTSRQVVSFSTHVSNR